MVKKRNEYTKEYKIGTVRFVLEERRSISEANRELGINEYLLHRWKKKYEEGRIEHFPGKVV